ncbi:MAG TPA: threonine/serine exporter family protein [Gemmatimonadaceae bacterium]|nr:threonine/serine exporter family protein [Gemmatimonadaceae bacterium]
MTTPARIATPTPLSLTALYEAPPSAEPTSDEDVVHFIAVTARALAAVDEIPARTEEALEFLAGRFGFTADCTATATSIFMTLSKGARSWTEVIRVRASSPDYTRAVALHRVLERVVGGEISPRDAAERLTTLLAWRAKPSVLLDVGAGALLTASAALLLRADRTELGLVALLGAMVGIVLHLVGGRQGLAPLATVMLAALASAAAFGFHRLGIGIVRPVPVIVASVVILLPGWRLTVSMSELAEGHWTAGSGRFLSAVVTLLLLVVGVVVGVEAVGMSRDGRLVLPATGNIPAWIRVLSPLAAGLALAHLFDARRKDAIWIILICILTSFASYVSGNAFGSTAGAFVGAFTATALGTLLARRLRLPYVVLQQPATVLLVPGTIGFLSFGSLLDQNVNGAIQTGFQMLLVALSLAIGALLARVLLRPVMSREYER